MWLGHVKKGGFLAVNVTNVGRAVPTFAVLISGAVVTEHIFALPGIGRYMIDNIYGRDYPVVQGVVLFMSLVVLGCSLLVDLLYTVVDPRIQYGD